MKNRLTIRKVIAFVVAGVLIAGVMALVGCTSSSSSSSASSSASASSASSAAADEMYTVPNVNSLTQADAEKVILASGLRLGTITREASDTIPLGSVISQEPKALSQAKPNSTVNLVVSTGKAKAKDVTVPDLKGKTQADAMRALNDLNLVGVASNPEESDAVQAGQVFKQSIEPGTTVKEGTKIAFTIAVAPAQSTVPNVVGLTEAEARAAFDKAKLGFDYAVAYNDKVEKGKVIAQSIAGGTNVRQGTTVSVTVSLGAKPVDDVEVPNVISFSWSDAEAALRSAGLAARYTGDPAGTVVAQDIVAGTKVAPNTLVTVQLVAPTPMVTVPNLIGLTVPEAEKITDALKLGLDINVIAEGLITDQWPEAGTEVEERTVISVAVNTKEPDWVEVKSADEAAKGAGLANFDVMDEVNIGDHQFTKPTFAYAGGVAQALYEQGAIGLFVRKAGETFSAPLTDRNIYEFPQEWDLNFKGLDIKCYGPDAEHATVIIWSFGKETFAATYQGLGGGEVTMTADDITSLVAGIQ